MKALVTGGCGYLGEELLKKLSKDCRCASLDISSTLTPVEGVEYVRADIRDRDLLKEIVKGVDVVYHNVAQVPLAKDDELFRTVNLDGTRYLLEACEAASVAKFVYTSSSAVYGVPESNPVSETTPPSPVETYGEAKLQGEKLVVDWAQRTGRGYAIIRPRTILGRGRMGIFQILFDWVAKGRDLPVFDRGDNVYQFVHVDDLADAIVSAGRDSSPDGAFNVGCDAFCSMRESLSGLIAEVGSRSRVVSLPSAIVVPVMRLFSKLGISPLGEYHARLYGKSLYFDSARAKTALNWSPKYGNIDMMVDSYRWYLENKHSIGKSGDLSAHKSPPKKRMLAFLPLFLKLLPKVKQ